MGPIHILGVELRTTNEGGRAFQDIPPFWQQFFQNNIAGSIPNKASEDIYGVYTHFDNEGKNNLGMYSLIIGCEVNTDAKCPTTLTSITIPKSQYHVFSVASSKPEKVGEKWQEIWEIPASEKKNWSFTCEFEHYKAKGGIDIYIGLK